MQSRFTYLPELLGRVFPTYSLQNLCTTGMLVYEAAHLVYIAVDDDVEALVDCIVLAHLFGGEFLRHRCGLLSARNSRQRFVYDRDYHDGLGYKCNYLQMQTESFGGN